MPHREHRRAALVLAGTAFGVLSLAGCAGTGAPANPATTIATTVTTAVPTTTTTPAPPTRQPHIVEFSATGTAKISTISYTIDGQTTTLAATPLPWHQDLNIPADGARHNYEVDLGYRDGSVVILATLDGQTMSTSNGSTSGGSGTAQLNGDFVG